MRIFFYWLTQGRIYSVAHLEKSEHIVAEPNQSDYEDHFDSAAFNDDMSTSQDQYQPFSSTSNLETIEAGFDEALLQQTPSLVVSSTSTGPNVSPQGFDDPRALVPDQVCTCAACLNGYACPLHLIMRVRNPDCSSWIFGCRITGCEWNTKGAGRSYSGRSYYPTPLEELLWHEGERSHYGNSGNYRCLEANCKFTTKRWGDLMRHSSSKHCINPKSFECPVIDCKYHHQGFTRKDKLNSHFQKVHGGNSQPRVANQAIKPKGGE